MVAFAHTSTGVIIGALTYQALGGSDLATGLAMAGGIGLLSHYFFDFVPHGHFFRGDKAYKKYIGLVLIFDLLLPILLFIGIDYYFNNNIYQILYIIFGIGGAQLPDILAGLKNLRMLPKNKLLDFEYSFHVLTHWHGKNDKALLFTVGDFWQVLFFICALYFVIR